jgi:N-acetylmuramoyl-L-alanine amidase
MKTMANLWIEDFVIPNQYSRPGYKLLAVRGIVMHWTATPGATDTNEQAFFDGSDGGGGRSASAHFFVDKDSATLILPLNEVAFHANEHACRIAKLAGSIKRPDGSTYVGGANVTALGIEMCVEKDGTIHPNTVTQSVDIAAELCHRYNLTANDIYRHFDITGKNCPAPWVSNPALYADFKKRVAEKLVCINTPTPTPATGTYKVLDGDTLWGISTKFKLTVAELKSLNGLTSDVINPGDVLKVVKPATVVQAPKPVTTTPKPVVQQPKPPVQAVPAYPGAVIKRGSTGINVERIQRAVGANPDGIFGSGTETKVKAYQSRHGLTADGIVGKDTWNTMF